MRPAIFLFLLCLIPLSLNAGVYKWVDAEGRTHFGDRPPERAAAEEVAVQPPSVSGDKDVFQRQQRMREFVDQSQKQRAEQQAAAAVAERKAAEAARECRRLQARVKFNESISSFYRVNDQGKREYYSDDEGRRIREKYQAKAAETCGR